jgi:hypothetical protein
MSDQTEAAAQPLAGYEPLPGIAPELAELFNRVNNYRASLKLPGLKMSAKLNQAAKVQADYLAANNLLSHEGKDAGGPTYIADRQFDVGYYGAPANENALQGGETAAKALESWQGSTGHNNTLTDKTGPFLFTGVAMATSSNGCKYWVQTFNGQPEDAMTRIKMARHCARNNPQRPVYDLLKENTPAECKRERATSQPPAGDGFAICDPITFMDGGAQIEATITDYVDGSYVVAWLQGDYIYSADLSAADMTKR